MTRRSWLTMLGGWLGFSALPIPAAAGKANGRYRVHQVTGARAMALWMELRERGEGYPIIIGSPEEARGLLYNLDEEIEQAAGRVADAAMLRFPEDLRTLRAATHAGIRAGLDPDARAGFDADWAIPENGSWPDVSPNPPSEPAVVRDHNDAYRDVVIVVLPTQDMGEALAMLHYAPGEYETVCPVEHHIAAVRHWQTQWGFELVCCYRGAIEGRVTRRPGGRAEALALAREQYEYCPDLAQSIESPSALAAILLGTDWWYFWWD